MNTDVEKPKYVLNLTNRFDTKLGDETVMAKFVTDRPDTSVKAKLIKAFTGREINEIEERELTVRDVVRDALLFKTDIITRGVKQISPQILRIMNECNSPLNEIVISEYERELIMYNGYQSNIDAWIIFQLYPMFVEREDVDGPAEETVEG